MTTHRIAVMPGDGIGKEVVPEGVRALEAAARKFRIAIEWREFDWSCDYYAKHGRMMPEDWFETLSPHDAIYYGAVGWPALVPDHVSLWGSLIQFRRPVIYGFRGVFEFALLRGIAAGSQHRPGVLTICPVNGGIGRKCLIGDGQLGFLCHSKILLGFQERAGMVPPKSL